MIRFVSCHLALSVYAVAALQGPLNLSVTSATNKQVKLTWKAGSSDVNQYAVERRPLDNTGFSTIALITPDNNNNLPTAYTDSNFDPFTAYVYRVRGMNTRTNPADTSDPSGEVTVGPPPYGYNRAVATPANLDHPENLGNRVQMVLDSSGDPVFAYLLRDPNNDGVFDDDEIYFLRWDRSHYVWTNPVRVAVAGDITGSYGPPFRLAFDAATSNTAVLYIDTTGTDPQVTLMDSSDGGATWRKRKVAGTPGDSYSDPALALGGGKVYLSFYHDFDGIRYLTGNLADNPAGWASELVPNIGQYYGRSSDVALDSQGTPGVAYLIVDASGHKEIFYRPGGGSYVANASSDGPGDFWQVRLGFAGTNPRIAFAGQVDTMYFADYDHAVFSFSSPDSGATWASRVNVISDGNTTLMPPVDFASDSKGRAAIVVEANGGNSDGVVCGEPKLSLSADLQGWKTCGITASYISRADSPSVKFAFNDTLYVAFQVPHYPFDATNSNELAAGVYFWRGPVGFQFPAPAPAQQ